MLIYLFKHAMRIKASNKQTNHTMTQKLCIYLFFLLGIQAAIAQNSIAKVTDAETGEGLPYANIDINGENIVSNAEGSFSIPEKYSADDVMVNVSFLGYHSTSVTVREIKANQLTVKLKPGFFELETVMISNVKPNGDSIIVAVKRNLARNYSYKADPSKNTFFYRESNSFMPIKLNVEINKSSGFSKEDLKTTNKQFQALTSGLIARPPVEFKELICNYYNGVKKVDGKPVFYGKYDIVKGIKLKDKNRATSVNEMEQMATGLLFKHLDTTKYYRIKSGLFGSRDTIPIGVGARKKGKQKTTELTTAKSDISMFISGTSFTNSYKNDFVTHPELYNYFYEGAISLGDQYVYVLKFTPKKSKAKYAGTLYVSDNDYAVVKADYQLAEGKTLGGVNLKFLLGVKQSENVSKGTLIFKERNSGGGYYLQYASVITGEYMYLNRPLKFIEITKEEKDVVAFDLKIETNMQTRQEYYSMSLSEISMGELESAKESEFSYLQLESYDPKIWKEYSAIEPLEEMKKFKASE